MNKQVLGTILGAALLGLAKSKGSSARKVSIEDIINKSTGGTGKVRVDFTVKIKPFWSEYHTSNLICDFDDELIVAQNSLKVYDHIKTMSQEWTVDDYNEGWCDEINNRIDQEGVEWYREHPEELYDDYMRGNVEHYLFTNTRYEPITISDYLDWYDLTDFVGLFNLSERIRLYSWYDTTKYKLAEEEGCEFKLNDWGEKELIGFDRDKYESLDGPRSLVEGYVEFHIKDLNDYVSIKKISKQIDKVEEYIKKMLEIAYDIKKQRKGASEGCIEIVSITFPRFFDEDKKGPKLRKR
jgi:hypothetical protein